MKPAEHNEILSFEEIVRVVEVAARCGIKHLRFTGGEPLVRKGAQDLIGACKNVQGIEDVAITTNGILLPRFASELKAAGLSRVNISLDSLDTDTYRTLTRCGNLDDALAGIHAALDAGFDPVKINTVVIRSMTRSWLRSRASRKTFRSWYASRYMPARSPVLQRLLTG